MKISYNWIKQYLKLDESVEKVSELLTDLGLEVEGVEPFESIKGGLKGILVGKVVTCIPHPNADKLKVTTVDLGKGKPVQIVCGATNVAVGQKVAVATVGTIFYNKDKEFKIKKSKIRGEESLGMICAEDELGLGNSHEGIMVLDDNLNVGTPFSEVTNIEIDSIFEIGLTPNRADAMSHIGVARDLYAGFKRYNKNYLYNLPKTKVLELNNDKFPFEIKIENTELCPRYTGVLISGVEVKPSPEWLQNRLKAIGLTPINNVVDITNFVLHELGQPLHAFDYDKIKGKTIKVRNAKQNEIFITLDQIERNLHKDDLVIADEHNAMCIAGVFGGIHSGVTKNTQNIFLESAYFNPVSIRKTSKRYGLNTDASFRYERGIDPNITIFALERAVYLFNEVLGKDLKVSSVYQNYPNPIENFKVEFSYTKAQKLIGKEISLGEIKSILEDLEIKIVVEKDNILTLNVPAYRVDVQRQADVVEEILRVYGYNNVEVSKKLTTSISYGYKYSTENINNIVSDYLSANGFSEIMANSLTKENYIELIEDLKKEHNVIILNPLSSDLSTMRQSMLFSGLEAVSHNINRKNPSLKLFELGKTYHKYTNGYTENKHLSIFVTGDKAQESWNKTTEKSDFYDLKSIVEQTLAKLDLKHLKYVTCKSSVFSEGLAIKIDKKIVVELGLVKISILKKMGIKQTVLYADFNWDMVLELVKNNKIQYVEIPKYPEVKRDLALLLDEKIQFDDIYQLAYKTEKNILKKVNLFDVYQGDKLPKGKKSYAISFTLQDETKTLTDKYIDKVMKKIQTSFEKNLDAELRQ